MKCCLSCSIQFVPVDYSWIDCLIPLPAESNTVPLTAKLSRRPTLSAVLEMKAHEAMFGEAAWFWQPDISTAPPLPVTAVFPANMLLVKVTVKPWELMARPDHWAELPLKKQSSTTRKLVAGEFRSCCRQSNINSTPVTCGSVVDTFVQRRKVNSARALSAIALP